MMAGSWIGFFFSFLLDYLSSQLPQKANLQHVRSILPMSKTSWNILKLWWETAHKKKINTRRYYLLWRAFWAGYQRVLELACQRQSGSLPPELKAGYNVRKVCREQRSLLQGFVCQNFCNETQLHADCIISSCISHSSSEDILSSSS